jgi:hypothetical protein
MAYYLVTCDLLSADHDYQALVDALDTVGVRACSSSWTIAVSETTTQVRDTLQALAAPGDRVFVATLEDGSWAAANVILEPAAELQAVA